MNFAIAALIPLILLIMAAHRIAFGSRNKLVESTGPRNPFTQLLLILGLAKLCRIPYITDNILSPGIQNFTGIANVMTLAGLTFGALSAVPVLTFSSYITGRNVPSKIQYAGAVTIIAAMIVTYVRTPMAHLATPYLQNHFAVTEPVLTFWVAFIAPIAASTLVSFTFVIREVIWVGRGPFARALAGVAASNLLGFGYCFVNVMTLVSEYNHTESFFLRDSQILEQVLGLAVLAAAGFSAGTYGWYILADRLGRYRLLRRYGDRWMEARSASPDVVLDTTDNFRPTRLLCWRASRSAGAAYRLQIELADHRHQSTRSVPAQT